MQSSSEEIQIVCAGQERIADLEPLWKALHTHHESVAPHLGAVRTAEESWTRRRTQYETLLSKPGSFVLIAERGRKPLGYALVHLIEGSATWQTADTIADLETLSVLPEARHAGIGTALMDAVFAKLHQADIHELSVSVVSTNKDALRFYERYGLVPKMLTLTGPGHLG